MNPGLSEDQRESFQWSRAAAPTSLEYMFWSWILGHWPANEYFEELMIVQLDGDGRVPDDFKGELL